VLPGTGSRERSERTLARKRVTITPQAQENTAEPRVRADRVENV